LVDVMPCHGMLCIPGASTAIAEVVREELPIILRDVIADRLVKPARLLSRRSALDRCLGAPSLLFYPQGFSLVDRGPGEQCIGCREGLFAIVEGLCAPDRKRRREASVVRDVCPGV